MGLSVMDIKEQASIILSNIRNYKKSFIGDLLITEEKYISDIFIQVTNEIIKKIEDDLTTGCFCLNTRSEEHTSELQSRI